MNTPDIPTDAYVSGYNTYKEFWRANWWQTFFKNPTNRTERLEKMGIQINGNVAIIPKNIKDVRLDINYWWKEFTFKMIILKHLQEIYNTYWERDKPYMKELKNSISLQQAIGTSEIHHIHQFDILLWIYLMYLGYTIKHEAQKKPENINAISMEIVKRMNKAAKL